MAKDLLDMLEKPKDELGLAPPLVEGAKKRGRHPGDCQCDTCKSRRAIPKPPPITVVEAAWQGLFILIRLIAGIFGFKCDVATLPMEECKEDAQVLILIPGIDRLKFLQWIGAPVVIVKRITQHFTKKPKEKVITPPIPSMPKAEEKNVGLRPVS